MRERNKPTPKGNLGEKRSKRALITRRQELTFKREKKKNKKKQLPEEKD